MKTITAIAPAKVNLSLKVGALDANSGKHDVANLMQTLTLHDNLQFLVASSNTEVDDILKIRRAKLNASYGVKETKTQVTTKGNLSVAITLDKRAGQNLEIDINDNLITKAIFLCAENLNFKDKLHVEVFVEKNIPAEAGLGGGSADAAAALVASPLIFGVETKKIDVADISKKLGSDVYYLTIGGRALMVTEGSSLKETYPSLKNPIVLVKPEMGVSTKLCYAKFDELKENDTPHGQFGLANDLLAPARELCECVNEAIAFLQENVNDIENVNMTGSGSACYAVTESFNEATKIAGKAKLAGFWAHACSFSPLGANAKVI